MIPLEVKKILPRLEELIRQQRFEELETHALEIKPVPPTAADWKKLLQSICAFMNTGGGCILLGVREEGQGRDRRYVFQGWRADQEGHLKELPRRFTDREGRAVDLTDLIPHPEIVPFLDGQVLLQGIPQLPEDRRYVFFEKCAYRRVGTGDTKISETEILRQEQRREAATRAQELGTVPGTKLSDFNLDALNAFIQEINQVIRKESIKPDLDSAASFLQRKHFLSQGQATILGLLVCGEHPSDHLGLRCQVHGFVDVPQEIARDKQILVDNILPLMERSFGYVLRKIHVGVALEQGEPPQPQYPIELLRETINNALAHRDYSIDKQVCVTIRPGESLSIENPGTFSRALRIESPQSEIPVLLLLPEAQPRNPKLAEVLSIYHKWEGRGKGMATLVDLALRNEIELPTYQLGQYDVTLVLRTGKLVDEAMERHFSSLNRFFLERLDGALPTLSQKAVLAYLMKCEWAHQQRRYTILLSHNNNHSQELHQLKSARLIVEHECSQTEYPVYVPCRRLMQSVDFVHQQADN
jgi:ATP-dependent DNA helicase RecG